MNSHFWWYLSRSAGTVAWLLVLASCAWGILLVTRLFRGYDRPAWLLDLHKWFGTLLLAATVLHLVALVGDNYSHFGPKELLIPFASSWHPRGVALGVLAMYMIAAIQITSWAMKKLPKKFWRAVHLSSYVSFILVTWHAITTGTDMTSRLYGALTIMMVTLAAALGAARLVTLRTPTKSPRLTQIPTPSTTKEEDIVSN